MTQEEQILVGQTDVHVTSFGNKLTRVHKSAVARLQKLKEDAKKAGFDLQVISGYRDFGTQLAIWNAKATGQRVLLDANAKPLEFSKLSAKEIVYAILRWSALPGASRHHWGTDFDVIDGAKIPKDYRVRLVPEEFGSGGIFSGLHEWLDSNMEKYDFFRPYEEDLGGVSPERWHLSYEPVSEMYLRRLTLPLLERVLRASQIELKDVVLAELPNIYERFVANISF